jgi:hypothetical protein
MYVKLSLLYYAIRLHIFTPDMELRDKAIRHSQSKKRLHTMRLFFTTSFTCKQYSYSAQAIDIHIVMHNKDKQSTCMILTATKFKR